MRQKRHQLDLEARDMLHKAETKGRDLTRDEERQFDDLMDERADLDSVIREVERDHDADDVENDPRIREDDAPGGGNRNGANESGWVNTDTRRPATLGPKQRFADHEVVRQHADARAEAEKAIVGTHGDIASLIRAISTTSGSAIVPTVWAGDVIDRARNLAAVLMAGAEIVPMGAKTVQIGRLTGDPSAAFRAEGSTITASDPTFDNVTLDAKSLSTLIVGSLEFFMDANNAQEVVAQAIAQAIAQKIDQVGLFGGLATDQNGLDLPTPPNPRGILATLNATAATSVLGNAVNGTVQTAGAFWSEVLDTVFKPQDFNEAPRSLLWSSRLARIYAKATDSTGQPLSQPNDVSQRSKFVTNQIPSYTKGTGTNMSDLFVGDFSQLLIGQRLDMDIKVLTERYAENGQIGIVAHWRGDVGLARPRAFSVFRALQGAA